MPLNEGVPWAIAGGWLAAPGISDRRDGSPVGSVWRPVRGDSRGFRAAEPDPEPVQGQPGRWEDVAIVVGGCRRRVRDAGRGGGGPYFGDERPGHLELRRASEGPRKPPLRACAYQLFQVRRTA